MKKEVNEFVFVCLVYQEAKIEHQRPSGKLQPLLSLDLNFLFLLLQCHSFVGE